jgi:hypothetical protein
LSLHRQRVGETAIPGCTLWFTLQTFNKLLDARHLFRENEIVGALDELAGLQVSYSVYTCQFSLLILEAIEPLNCVQ